MLKKSLDVLPLNNFTGELLAVLTLYVLTFPSLDVSFGTGLDISFFWALNYLFEYNYESLIKLIYPLGPLAFLKNPVVMGNNVAYHLLFYTTIKCWFIYGVIKLAKSFSDRKPLLYLLLFLVLTQLITDYLVIGVVVIHSFLLLAGKGRDYVHVIATSILAAIGLSMKSSLGIITFSVILTSQILLLVEKHQWKRVGINLCLMSISTLFIGLVVFKDFGLCIQYIENTIRFTLGYSSALALYPRNNYFLLFLCLSSTLAPALLIRDKNTRNMFLLLVPALFAMWKHAMSRQDQIHSEIFFVFLLLYWTLLIASSRLNPKKLLFLGALSTASFHSNMQYFNSSRIKTFDFNGMVNFEQTVLNFSRFEEKADSITAISLDKNRLPDYLLESELQSGTVDVYPWELSYFAANKELDWKPRRSLQSGSFSQWVDKMNQIDFNRETGPEHIIFHFVPDRQTGNLGSIDDRYLLNDNPLTIMELFNTYNVSVKTNSFMLLSKNEAPNLIETNTEVCGDLKWDTWLTIPESVGGITRLQLHIDRNWKGDVISFFYKPGAYFIDYKFKNGEQRSYRFVPENAIDGIWLNPFVIDPDTELFGTVEQVRIRCSHEQRNHAIIEYCFQSFLYQVDDVDTDFRQYFDEKLNSDRIILERKNEFEYESEHTMNVDFAFSGKGVNLVKKQEGYSFTYDIMLDTVWSKLDSGVSILSFQTQLSYLNPQSEAVLVVDISESNYNIWESQKLVTTDGSWKTSSATIELKRSEHSSGRLKIFVWNTGNEDVLIDDFSIRGVSF